ncbi:MAG TPA: alkaline phosphatase family protein [Longimicrobiales bacterium]
MASEPAGALPPLTGATRAPRRLLFLFLDGVGIAPADAAVNALAAARLPVLRGLLDGAPPTVEGLGSHAAATLLGLDATLGVDGLPQSGTGQTALLTGENAPRLFGRHFGPWVPTALRPLMAERSILARARAAGRTIAFANAYPEELLELARARPGLGSEAGTRAGDFSADALARLPGPLRAGPPLAALGAGALTRHTPELERGEAVSSEIVNDGWIERLARTHLPHIPPEEAGHNLAAIAVAHELTLYAHYTTDAAGHHRELPPAIAAIERVDAFLGGVLQALPPDVLLVLTSDHGNVEDCRAGHTRNPAMFLAAGEGHQELATDLRSLTDVAPRLLEWLEMK